MMMKLFNRRRSRGQNSNNTSTNTSLFDDREASYVTTSTRTGGYEVARESDYRAGDDDTILDQSLYTLTDHSLLEKATVVSTATTVKQGALQQRRYHSRRPVVLETRDIQPKLEMYQRNVATGRLSPAVVTPTEQSEPPQDPVTTPPWGSARKKLFQQGKASDVYNPDSLKGLNLVPSPESTNTTVDETAERIQKIEPVPLRFEFAAMEEIPKKKNKDDDDENESVHSFSFSQTEEEIGFEVDDPYPLINQPSESCCKEDESSIASEPSIDVASRANMTDSELLDGRSSPGALRLTEEGLKQHEKKTFKEARHKPENHSDEFEAWRKEHETRKWYRKRLKEREQKLLDANLKLRESRQSTSDSQPPKRCSVSFRVENDVADLSTAPLAAMQHLNLNRSAPKRRSFQLFRKKGKPTAEELLERERQRAREAKRLEECQRRQEKDRIARKRRDYLEQQRAKEIVGGGALTRTPSSDTNPNTMSTLSTASTVTPTMPHCVLCLEEVRTHIATPCMHFSFCADCVEKLQKSDKNECPVCRQPNVSYASVAV